MKYHNMYNPFTILNPELLAAMLRQPMYFVRQHYPRGKDILSENDLPLLLTHYAHHEIEQERAERHMRLLFKDPYRCLYDSTKPEDLEKLQIAAAQPEGYRVYINLLPKEWKANTMLKLKIGDYVRHRMPWWNYSPKDKLQVTLKERYGELFIALLWRGQQTEVHLNDIENFSACATT